MSEAQCLALGLAVCACVLYFFFPSFVSFWAGFTLGALFVLFLENKLWIKPETLLRQYRALNEDSKV